jgi:cold shock CspA family protein/tetratricopeptide (TPR) repeat protein
VKALVPECEKVVAVRNRVAHSRPLDLDDLARVIDFSEELAKVPGRDWTGIKQTLKDIVENPGFVLGLTPNLIVDDGVTRCRHNLPAPDFDETGFLGRRDQRRALLRALKGPWPVLSILGDGGLGKTALALRVAYDILDDADCPFEAIVWTSAKKSMLTTSEIVRIEGAIQDSLGLFGGAAQELGGPTALKDPVNEVLNYLATFPILLILDNLETVIDDRIRGFLRDLPNGSKVLITSRIGVGTENPFKLAPLTTPEASILLRSLARVRDVVPLRKLDQPTVEQLVTRMKCHPAFIKWFVSGVQAGETPERLVEENGLLLNYCMANVYQYLSGDATAILRSMMVLPGSHTLAELAFVNEFTANRIQSTVLELTTTNFLTQDTVSGGSTGYSLSDFAKSYLQKHHSVGAEERRWLLDRHRELYKIGGSLQTAYSQDPFAPETIDIRNAGDYSAARNLVVAFERFKAGKSDEALELCREAGNLAPGYHEPHRVAAYIHECMLNYTDAYDEYDCAKDLVPENPYVRFFFGNFLIDTGFNIQHGLQELQYAARLDKSPQILLSVAYGHFVTGDYRTAIAVASAILDSLPPNSRWANPVLSVALNAAMSGAQTLQRLGDWEVFAEVIESVMRAVERASVVDLDSALLDSCLALESWCRIGQNMTADDFIARRCVDFANRIRERRRQADPDHLARRLGSVKSTVPEKGFGFVTSEGRDYFFHVSSLSDRTMFEELLPGSSVAFWPASPRGGSHPRAEDIVVVAYSRNA